MSRKPQKTYIDMQRLVEARYTAVMEDQTSLVVGFARDGGISCVSRGFTILLNTTEEALLNTNLLSLIYEEDLPNLQEALSQVERARSNSCEVRLGMGNTFLRQKWDIRGIYSGDQLIEYQATGRIITGDSLTRAQLEDGSVFRRFTENIPVMIYLFNQNRFIYVNRSFEISFGYKHMELLNMGFWELVHPDYRDIVKKRGLAILEAKEPVPANWEVMGISKGGDIIWMDVFVNIIEMSGETVGLVAAYDITQRKQLEKALDQYKRDLEQRVNDRTAELSRANQELTIINRNMNNIFENMSDGVIYFNRDGQIKIFNPDFDRVWGQAARNWRKYVDQRYFYHKIFEEGAFLQDEEFIVPTGRGQAHFVASASPIADDQGHITGCLVLIHPIERALRMVNRFTGAQARFRFEDIITRSLRMIEVIENARKAANSRSIILIEGESGTGKEMFAHAIHNESSRCNGPFVALNCAAIPRDLIGSEMFGYVEGAFTGARRGGSPGKFELASGGTMFLDEIGDMPLEQQAVLLRVIQEQQLARIGGNQLIPIDVRIICATNKDLWTEVQAGTFRKDLYYRLNVINIIIPPLRERSEDIALLLEYYFQKSGNVLPLPPEILDKMRYYTWPGNVRELQNLIEKMTHCNDPVVTIQEWMTEAFRRLSSEASLIWSVDALEQARPTISQVRQNQKKLNMDQESTYILELLAKYQGNVSRVAREMGIARSTLYKKMNDYHIEQ